MDNIKDDIYYLRKMLHLILILEEYIEHLNELNKTICKDDQDSDGIVYKFTQLKEESKNINQEFLDRFPELNLSIKKLSGFRNMLIHDYENIKYSSFQEILDIDIPVLKKLIIDAIDNS